ncbi:MAG: hypothetical protein ACKO38_13115 [Planctomycetota bacterium]
MTLKAAIIAALPPESILCLAQAAWPKDSPADGDSARAVATQVSVFRQRLRRSPRVTLADTLAALNKEALVTICRVVGIDHRGRRAELTDRLIAFDANSRGRSVPVSSPAAVAAPVAATPTSASSTVASARTKPVSSARVNSRGSRIPPGK